MGSVGVVPLPGNDVLPHTKEPDDSYELYNLYDPASPNAPPEWLINGEAGPYLKYIKALSPAWPDLRFLGDWMEVTTTPLKWKAIKAHEEKIRAERARRTKVAVVDFSEASIDVGENDIVEPDDLRRSLREALSPDTHRLYVVEDLSRDVIEVLGSELDIDPVFFREHICDYLWYNTRDPWVELPVLQVLSATRPYFKMRYFQARYFKSSEELQLARKEAALFNVLRRVDYDRNHSVRLDDPGACVGLVRCKASFWCKPVAVDEPSSTSRVAVLLIDPPIQRGDPLWKGYRNFNSPPSLSAYPGGSSGGGGFEIPPKASLFESFKFWTRHMVPATDSRFIPSNPAVMAYRMAQIVAAEWVTITEYVTTRLGQIEWELEDPGFRRSPGDLPYSLTKLHPWRRLIPLYKTMFDESRVRLFHTSPAFNGSGGGGAPGAGISRPPSPFLIPPSPTSPTPPSALLRQESSAVTAHPPAPLTPIRPSSSSAPAFFAPFPRRSTTSLLALPGAGASPVLAEADPIARLLPDYLTVSSSLTALEKRIKRVAAVAAAVISIDESRQAADHNKALGRLTVLLFVFAPLSFVASVLSMNSDLGTMLTTLWIYASVAVPITLLLVLAVGADAIVRCVLKWWGGGRNGNGGAGQAGGDGGRAWTWTK